MPDQPPGPAAGDPAAAEPVARNVAALGMDFPALDEIARQYQRGGGQPGIAYGIVTGGVLAHAGGVGQRWAGGPAPDAGTVFRIASMTKSFTAAAVLTLRDDGVLRLDDPAADYVPELRGIQATADSPPVTIRQLLTMTAGFPTDDPWGDRQQGLPLKEFAEFLASGLSFAWAPGTCFEYSNLGYAILGRVIAAASQTAYPDFVRQRLFSPLSLALTGYEAAEFPADQLARGYRRGPDGWEELVPDGCGAFAPMGGVFSCVRDLARWVSGFAEAFPAGVETDGGPHPLRRAARREMQLPQVAILQRTSRPLTGDADAAAQQSYGFGLFISEDPRWGRIVSHSGGYPGFGSHMRWHPATGTGSIVLANSTYAATQPLAARLLDAVLRAAPASGRPGVRGLAAAPGEPWPETLAAQQAVSKLLLSWDDATAAQLFTENVGQDEPYPERREKIERVRQRIGPLAPSRPDLGAGPDPDRLAGARPAEYDSPAHCRWWLHGARGDAQVEIRLTPERHPRVQSLVLTVPPAPDSALWQQAQAVISLLNDGARQWPATLPVSASAHSGLLLRQLRMASAWAGPARPGAFCGGNGETSTTVELDGETARLTLTVELDEEDRLRSASIAVRP